MKSYFKIMLTCLCAVGSMNSFSQQYFRASVGGGVSTIQYDANEISSELLSPSSLGGGVTAEYIMFFSQHLGASIGVGVSVAQSKYKLNDILSKEMPYTSYEDYTTKSFVYNAKFEDWEEKQMLYTVDIPVGVVGKYTFSDKITAMAGLGVRLQLPIKSSYSVSDGGKRTTTGYFKDVNATLEDIPHQGFYVLEDCPEGSLKTKTVACAAYLDLGVMHKIGKQSFYYGIYGQYGFTQVNAEADKDFLVQYSPYDSPLNTTAVEKSRLLSFGIKLGYVLPLKEQSSAESTVESATEESVESSAPEGTNAPASVSEEAKTDSPATTDEAKTEAPAAEK